jgi:hypothetical protein
MQEHPPLEYLLALAAVLSAVTGSALTVVGHHLFDKIEVAARWSRIPAPHETSHRENPAGAKDDGPTHLL